MKKLGLVLAAAMIAGPAMADNQDVKVSGQIFANYMMNQDLNKETGFTVDRARATVDGMFNESWMAQIVLEGKTADTTTAKSSFFVKKAFIQGKDIFNAGDHVRFGAGSNAWKDLMYKHSKNRWIEKVALHDRSYSAGEVAGVRYGNFSNAFKYSVSLHSGNDDSTGATGQDDDATGIELYLGYAFNDAMGLHVLVNNDAEEKKTGAADKRDTTAVAFNYNAHGVDALIEMAQLKVGSADARSTTKAMVSYNYSDNKGVYLGLQNHNKDEETASSVKSNTIAGHYWTLAKGLKTGVFYNMQKASTSANDQNTLLWKWEAKF